MDASYKTMYGKLSSTWNMAGEKFNLAVEIPANTRATVRLLKAWLGKVRESGSALRVGNGIESARQDGDSVVVEIGSGVYRFTYMTVM